MKVLEWLTFIVLFCISLSFATESYESSFEDSTSESSFAYEDSTLDSTFDYASTDSAFDGTLLIVEDSGVGSTFDYPSTVDNSTSENNFDYESVFNYSASEDAFDTSIKNLLYPPYDRDCPVHEHWEYCTGLCQRNCSNWSKALICPDICVQGCLCDWGFTRGHEGNCIPVSECPPIEDEEPIKINVQYKCKLNEHFSHCEGQKECQKNCLNYDKEIPCGSRCKSGCICDEGFVRGPSGICIPTQQCQDPLMQTTFESKKPLTRLCRNNEHFSACSGLPLCQRSCSNYNESIICPLICVPGCICDKGYVVGPTGECIPLEQCAFEMKLTSTQVDFGCSENEHFSFCSAHCQHSCSNMGLPIPCPGGCSSGCVCDAGYVRGPTNDCILVEECNSSENKAFAVEDLFKQEEDFCPPNEVFSPCFAHCQKNCTSWSDLTMPCLKICVPGCICDNGMVRGPHGNCIQPRKCPSSHDLQSVSESIHADCPVDEHFERCKAHCQKNCTNWDQEIKCERICVPGCVCDKDFVRGPFGKCVLAEKCSSLDQNPKRSIKKNSLNSCPEGEQRSNIQPLDGSNVYCFSEKGVIEFCPPTFFNGCVCKKGQVRGDDNLCLDRRLLPNANEIHFMHDDIRSSVDPESNSNRDIIEEFFDSSKSIKNSILDSTISPSVIPEMKINEQREFIEEISTTITQNEPIDILIDSTAKSHGCPIKQKCIDWCKGQGFLRGTCAGIGLLQCICSKI